MGEMVQRVKELLCRIGLHRWRAVHGEDDPLWGPLLTGWRCECGEYREDMGSIHDDYD